MSCQDFPSYAEHEVLKRRVALLEDTLRRLLDALRGNVK